MSLKNLSVNAKASLLIIICLVTLSGNAQWSNLVTAKFANGQVDLEKYISENCTISKYAKRKKFSGELAVSFRVNFKGKVDSVWLKESDDFLLLEPLKDLFMNMPGWQPARTGYTYVACIINHMVSFNPELPVFIPKAIEKELNKWGQEVLTESNYSTKLKEHFRIHFKKNKKFYKKAIKDKVVIKLYRLHYNRDVNPSIITGQSYEINDKLISCFNDFNKSYSFKLLFSKTYSKLIEIDFSKRKPIVRFLN